MQEQNIDINLIIQSFQERISQLITEVVVKEATIKQLNMQIQTLQKETDDFSIPMQTNKKEK